GQDYPVFQPAAEGGENVDFAVAPEPDTDLTLAQALSLTMRYSADLASSAWEIKAREGEQLQAGLLPNPELSIEAENFAGDNAMSGYDSAETTIAVSQLLEMGGKRQKRSLIADLGRQLAIWDHERKRLDILTEVTKAYVDVVAGQQRVAQTIVLGELAGAVQRAVRERVEAGKVSPLELTRAGVELSAAHLSSLKARRTLKSARKTLVSFWGASDARFGRAIDGLKTTPVLPPFELLVKAIGSNPDLARWTTALKQKQIESELAKAIAVPDVTVSVGARNFQETGDHALVAVLEVPLMFFDRNQGGRQQALAEIQRIRREQQAAQTRIRADLSVAYQEFMSADDELLVLVKEMLPGAEQAFKATNLGYREGKFGFLEMVDAQRTLFEVRGQYVASLATYHKAKADIERLIARPLAGLTTESNIKK
ncbi:MAG: TolC family protein, partial [Geopsychrobacter sp.]|nr:TolC family protein [Geopsychrobacter sp.]